MTLQARLTRIARQVGAELYATPEDEAEAMAAAIIDELELEQIWTPISASTGEATWTGDYYSDQRQAEKAVAADGGTLGTAWLTAWERA